MQPHTIDTRWVKIHSVRKILVFLIFHITSLFLCVTLHLCASALKSTAVFRVNSSIELTNLLQNAVIYKIDRKA